MKRVYEVRPIGWNDIPLGRVLNPIADAGGVIPIQTDKDRLELVVRMTHSNWAEENHCPFSPSGENLTPRELFIALCQQDKKRTYSHYMEIITNDTHTIVPLTALTAAQYADALLSDVKGGQSDGHF